MFSLPVCKIILLISFNNSIHQLVTIDSAKCHLRALLTYVTSSISSLTLPPSPPSPSPHLLPHPPPIPSLTLPPSPPSPSPHLLPHPAELGDYSSKRHTLEVVLDMDLIPEEHLRMQNIHTVAEKVIVF